jgi:hypothetical protein
MSRLDDELKVMFQRQEPAADFSERVLARIQAKAQPSPSLWQRLVAFFQPNAMPWALAAAAILLAAIIGFTQYQRLHSSAPDTRIAREGQGAPDNKNAATAPPDSRGTTSDSGKLNSPQNDKGADGVAPKRVVPVLHKKAPRQHLPRLKYVKAPAASDWVAAQPKSAGELAKEQLLKALSIASATVNEAKKLALGSD